MHLFLPTHRSVFGPYIMRKKGTAQPGTRFLGCQMPQNRFLFHAFFPPYSLFFTPPTCTHTGTWSAYQEKKGYRAASYSMYRVPNDSKQIFHAFFPPYSLFFTPPPSALILVLGPYIKRKKGTVQPGTRCIECQMAQNKLFPRTGHEVCILQRQATTNILGELGHADVVCANIAYCYNSTRCHNLFSLCCTLFANFFFIFPPVKFRIRRSFTPHGLSFVSRVSLFFFPPDLPRF